MVRDLDRAAARPLLEAGAGWADTNRDLTRRSDLIITCLPSPSAMRSVMEDDDGVLSGLGPGKIWLEMSTTDEAEVRRLGDLVTAVGARALDGPVSGGCHRAATGNISIFVGGDREDFERALPILTAMGRRILHAGGLGAASVLKVVTNYLALVHLVALGEAMMVARQSGMDLTKTYEAIRISSGNSFVHETESQVIRNGSYDINFTMDLVVKDMSLFQQLTDQHETPVELSPLVLEIFREGERTYGSRVDTEPEEPGYEVIPAPM